MEAPQTTHLIDINKMEFDPSRLVVPMRYRANAASIYSTQVTTEIMRLMAQFHHYTRQVYKSKDPKYIYPFNEVMIYSKSDRIVYDISNSLAFMLTNRIETFRSEFGVATEFTSWVRPTILNWQVESSVATKLIYESPLGHVATWIKDLFSPEDVNLEWEDFWDAWNYMKIGFISEETYQLKRKEIDQIKTDVWQRIRKMVQEWNLTTEQINEYMQREASKIHSLYRRLNNRYSTYARKTPFVSFLTNEWSGIQHDFVVTLNYELPWNKVGSDVFCVNNTEKSWAELAELGNFGDLKDLVIATADHLFLVLKKARESKSMDTVWVQDVSLRKFNYDWECNVKFTWESRWMRK